jgi:hypothetical protein
MLRLELDGAAPDDRGQSIDRGDGAPRLLGPRESLRDDWAALVGDAQDVLLPEELAELTGRAARASRGGDHGR